LSLAGACDLLARATARRAHPAFTKTEPEWR
jgi:hypothetical protein